MVFDADMLGSVGDSLALSHSNRPLVVFPYYGRASCGAAYLGQKTAQPHHLPCRQTQGDVFCLCRRQGDAGLLLADPADRAAGEDQEVSRGRLALSLVSGKVRVRVSLEIPITTSIADALGQCSLQVSQCPLQSSDVMRTGILAEARDQSNCMGQVGPRCLHQVHEIRWLDGN